MKKLFTLCVLFLVLFSTVNTDAQTKAWGNNEFGELGDGTFGTANNRNVPTNAFTAYTDITGFGGGGRHTIALRANGTLLAVGNNLDGQLGDGTTTTTGCMCKTTPVQVRNFNNTTDLSNIVQVSSGGAHSLALDKDGKVWAWGNNQFGQLGNGSITNSNLPVQAGQGLVGFDGQVIAIDAGGAHNLALTSDGKIWAWGKNEFGEIGDGTTTQRDTPVQVKSSATIPQFDNVLQIAAGSQHSIVLRRDGTIWVWGNNFQRQVGNPSITDNSVPYPVQTLQTTMGAAVQIAAGVYHNMALTQAGEVWVWGYNGNAQLGNGSHLPELVTEPTKNTTLSNIIDIKADVSFHSMVRNRSGEVIAWGYNANGAVGNGTFSTSFPQAVTTPYTISALGAGNALIGTGSYHSLLSNPVIAVSTGTNQILRGENVNLSFASITGAGNVAYTAIDATATGLTTPAGYIIQGNAPAYDVTTTTASSGNIDVCLKVPSEYSQTAFANLKILHGEGSALVDRTYTSTYARRQICARVTSLSPFVIAQGLAPTAASVTVSGRILSGKGSAIPRAIVTLTDSNGAVRTALTNPFGYYRFEEIGVGQTYIFTVSSKRYEFAPRVLTPFEDVENLDFTAH